MPSRERTFGEQRRTSIEEQERETERQRETERERERERERESERERERERESKRETVLILQIVSPRYFAYTSASARTLYSVNASLYLILS